jgi:hypothetical protein
MSLNLSSIQAQQAHHSLNQEIRMDILDQYVQTTPSAQNALDIFKGEWSSKIPVPDQPTESGNVPLFEDSRIAWAASQLGGFQNKSVLELGPLEGGHTYMIERAGAASVTAIEANTRAYLKCLVVKEILDLKRSHFLCGDFMAFLRSNTQKFDVSIASGVLYHMQNPVELIQLLAATSNQVMFWTHYYDRASLECRPEMQFRLSEGVRSSYEGFDHTLYRQEYGAALGWAGFCGAGTAYTHWISREDILNCCKHFGFNQIETSFEQPDHPNGPSFALVATK